MPFPVPENVEEKLKRQKIEAALADPDTPMSKWQEFAKTEYGLVNGNYHLLLLSILKNGATELVVGVSFFI